ncbi:unnamed protein product [Phyllotreta striolata]|uniref:Uncharacterized protein n=1 Tax=Phyllotreta striolata TaxID=444603 RepID=A0A9N9U2Q3_PHYSR|nr:unnamed protein product [Phyllotreta striolata]
MALQRVSFAMCKIINEGAKLKRSKLNTALVFAAQMRFISSIEITKNISLISNEKKPCKIVDMQLDTPQNKPLMVMLSWLMARKKHVHKYADLYLKHGYDVLNINVSPWQLLWPTKGTQMVAKDLLKFLEVNTGYPNIVLHGFSVGAYLWGEVLVNISSERQRYEEVLNRVTGQVWDSAADITEIPVGLPPSVFPRNKVLQNTMRQYVIYHMKTFDKVATVHYVRSSQMFHTNLARAPALFLLSKSDPIGAERSNQRVRENWENMGIQVTWKCWDKSPHVGHFRFHPKEYVEELESFLASLKIPAVSKAEQVQVKL